MRSLTPNLATDLPPRRHHHAARVTARHSANGARSVHDADKILVLEMLHNESKDVTVEPDTGQKVFPVYLNPCSKYKLSKQT